MAKAIRAYSGRDTYGRRIELAEREDGKWFYRGQENRGRYGWAMSKWLPHKDAVTHPEKLQNVYSLEFIEIPEDRRHLLVEWGFKLLSFTPDGHKGLRLPK